jgi:LysM repeat protein
LRSGEHPYCIARRYNVDPIELLNRSGLNVNSRPGAGYSLTLPQTGNPFPSERMLAQHPTTYTVGSGETVYSIACKFGDVAPEAIGFANNLAAPYTLTPGQTIQIP